MPDSAAAVHEADHLDEDGNLDDDADLEPDTVEEELEGQDDLDDDELQSMLQDDDDSPGAITDTANTDWYLHSYKAAHRSTAQHLFYHLWYVVLVVVWYCARVVTHYKLQAMHVLARELPHSWQ